MINKNDLRIVIDEVLGTFIERLKYLSSIVVVGFGMIGVIIIISYMQRDSFPVIFQLLIAFVFGALTSLAICAGCREKVIDYIEKHNLLR